PSASVTPPKALRELPIAAKCKTMPLPKLDEAPTLASAPRPNLVLPPPAQAAPIHPPVQTGVFGSNLPAQANPVLPVPATRNADFDAVAVEGPAAPRAIATAPAGFDSRSTDSRPTTSTATVQTGAFGQPTA